MGEIHLAVDHPDAQGHLVYIARKFDSLPRLDAGTIRISGDLTESQSRLLARALNSGAVPIVSDDETAAASDTIAPRRQATTTCPPTTPRCRAK